MVVLACGLALIALLATSSLAAASDPIGGATDLATTSGESSPELPPSSEPSVSAEVTATSEPSVSAEVTATSDPSLSAEVTATSEPSVSVEPGPPQAPVPGEGPVEPVPPPQTLLAPVTELVAEQPPAAALPDVDELVAPPPSLDGLPVPSTDPVTTGLLNITELDATADVPDLMAPLFQPAAETLREPIEDADEPATADPWLSNRFAIDGRATLTPDGEPAEGDIASRTLISATRIVRPAAADRGWHREAILASVAVSRIAAGSAGSAGGNSTTDQDPSSAVLAALAAGGAGWLILRLRMPPIPAGIWLAAPVPPG